MENEILSDINRRFDHAVLRSDATGKDIVFACNEAKKFDFFFKKQWPKETPARASMASKYKCTHAPSGE